MNTDALVLNVGGVPVAVNSHSADYAACATNRLGASTITDLSGDDCEISLELIADAASRPARSPDQSVEGYDGWSTGEGFIIAGSTSVVEIAPGLVKVWGPISDRQLQREFDHLLQFGIVTALATPERIMIHAAIIARDGAALALVGRSGAGKSTLALAALLDGWELLGDDLAVVHPATGQVEAIQRPPMVPANYALEAGLTGVQESDDRGRLRLPTSTLSRVPAELVGIVAVQHGATGSIDPQTEMDLRTLDDCLGAPAFAFVMRRHLAAAARLVARPTVVLSHAADPAHRIAVSQRLLLEALEFCTQSNAPR